MRALWTREPCGYQPCNLLGCSEMVCGTANCSGAEVPGFPKCEHFVPPVLGIAYPFATRLCPTTWEPNPPCPDRPRRPWNRDDALTSPWVTKPRTIGRAHWTDRRELEYHRAQPRPRRWHVWARSRKRRRLRFGCRGRRRWRHRNTRGGSALSHRIGAVPACRVRTRYGIRSDPGAKDLGRLRRAEIPTRLLDWLGPCYRGPRTARLASVGRRRRARHNPNGRDQQTGEDATVLQVGNCRHTSEYCVS